MVENYDKPFLFDLPKIEDARGNLSFLQIENQVPFSIARVYWIYDVPGGQERGSHAFKTQQEIIIALSGSFDVVLHDGVKESSFSLNRAYKALYVPRMTWRTIKNFSTNSVCLVLNSGAFSEEEYIRDFDTFVRTTQAEEMRERANAISLNRDYERKNTVFDCSLLEFPVIKNRAGNITAIESSKNLPFHINRVFHIYDIPNDAERGMHAHMNCHELLVATTGSFDVELDDGINKKTVRLYSPKYGLYIPPGIWSKEKHYSSGATCLALASEKYEKEGYINTYEEFKKFREHEG